MNDMEFLVLVAVMGSGFINLFWLMLGFLLRTPRGYRGSTLGVFVSAVVETLLRFLVGTLAIYALLWVGYVVFYR